MYLDRCQIQLKDSSCPRHSLLILRTSLTHAGWNVYIRTFKDMERYALQILGAVGGGYVSQHNDSTYCYTTPRFRRFVAKKYSGPLVSFTITDHRLI